jgi:hypothetical protein
LHAPNQSTVKNMAAATIAVSFTMTPGLTTLHVAGAPPAALSEAGLRGRSFEFAGADPKDQFTVKAFQFDPALTGIEFIRGFGSFFIRSQLS